MNAEPGDIVVCIDDSTPCACGCGLNPALGANYKVRDALIGPGSGLPKYKFFEIAGMWNQDRFRKIRPDEHEDCEPEFVTLLESFKVPAPLSEEGVLG